MYDVAGDINFINMNARSKLDDVSMCYLC
jgi:hypothetical protein